MGNGKIIDCHTHILNEATLREYEAALHAYGTEAGKILAIRFFEGFANGVFDGRDREFDSLLEKHENLYVVEPVDINRNIGETLDRLGQKMEKADRIKAVKLYTGYQHFYPQDERLRPVYEFCLQRGLPVIFHSGALYEYEKSKALLKYAQPIHVDEVAVAFPENRFVISHLGFPYMYETATVVCKNQNVYTDISGVIDRKSSYNAYLTDLKKLLDYYPALADRLMFGTDFIGNDTLLSEVELYVRIVEEAFDEEQCRRVFHENAERLYFRD